MKLSVLVENNIPVGNPFNAEHGLSIYIEDSDCRVLFDTGQSSLFIENAIKMNVDLGKITHMVISHSHYDHTGGIKNWIEKFGNLNHAKSMFIAHDAVFDTKISIDASGKEFEKHDMGTDFSTIDKYFKICVTSANVIQITENLIFLGQIERSNDFENKKPLNRKTKSSSGIVSDDYYIDDSALIYKTTDGVAIITGCSHSGICNIIQNAKKIAEKFWNCGKIVDIIGGFHLVKSEEALLRKTTEFIKSENIENIHTCHCTDLSAKIYMSQHGLNLIDVGVGTALEYI